MSPLTVSVALNPAYRPGRRAHAVVKGEPYHCTPSVVVHDVGGPGPARTILTVPRLTRTRWYHRLGWWAQRVLGRANLTVLGWVLNDYRRSRSGGQR